GPPVDGLPRLLGTVDQRHLVAHGQLDDAGEHRVVRAAEHERVHVGRRQRGQVGVGQAEHLPTPGVPALDEGDEPRAGGRRHLVVVGGAATRSWCAPLARVAAVPITPTRPFLVAATARRTAGRTTSTTGTPYPSRASCRRAPLVGV